LLDLDVSNAALFLAGRLGVSADPLRITALGGGVSNTVLLVEGTERRFVVKQSLARLRVEQDWFSDRSRIFREAAALRWLAPHLPPGAVPAVVFEDRENYAFAMTAAPAHARTWKALLLEGHADPSVSRQVAWLLARILRASWLDAGAAARFGDQTAFDELRLEPYYRATALRHPDLAAFFGRLVETYPQRRLCLVHGDWSPKNFLVWDGGLMAIDFEVIHFGDPVFDVAFLLNHLLLKCFHRPEWAARYAELAAVFWQTLEGELPEDPAQFQEGVVRHLGALLLARMDGKSPVEYIREPDVKQRVRSFARALIADPPARIASVFDRLTS
jgi:5-methylthioribose kinase